MTTKDMILRRILTAITLLLSSALLLGQSADQHPDWPGKGQLFVGTCYQPVDRSPEQIRQDIALMKQAGFTRVRMGDLSWDAFEPSEGQFEFAWFDNILHQMNQGGIKVILDIGGSPAPIWLHHKYPSVNMVDEHGATVQPAERYMDDISAPAYREHLIHFADELTRHYAHNPALAAIGYNNEIGNGVMSYSQADRQRFIEWLKAKYGTIENLNKAWATQRWSRHLNSFDEVQLPYVDGPAAPERYLDLRRFWSDVTISVLEDLERVRERNVPNLPAVSNLWDTAGRRGFDYMSSYKKYVSYGAEGFYPANPLDVSFGALLVKGDLPTPAWFNEFTSGGGGSYGGPKGIIRMWAYLALIDYGQTFLAWTFNTHRGGKSRRFSGCSITMERPRGNTRSISRSPVSFRSSSTSASPAITSLKLPSLTHLKAIWPLIRRVQAIQSANISLSVMPTKSRAPCNLSLRTISMSHSLTSVTAASTTNSWLCQQTT